MRFAIGESVVAVSLPSFEVVEDGRVVASEDLCEAGCAPVLCGESDGEGVARPRKATLLYHTSARIVIGVGAFTPPLTNPIAIGYYMAAFSTRPLRVLNLWQA